MLSNCLAGHNYEIREIKADDPDLPEWLYLVEANSYAEAVPLMLKSGIERPALTPVWLDVAHQISPEMNRFTRFWAERRWTQDAQLDLRSPQENPSNFMDEILENHARAIPQFNDYRAGALEFKKHVVEFSRAAQAATDLHTLQIYISRRKFTGTGTNGLHHDYLNEDINGYWFRFSQTWQESGTAHTHDDDWMTENHQIVGIASTLKKMRKKPIIWQQPPGSLALIVDARLHGFPFESSGHRKLSHRMVQLSNLKFQAIHEETVPSVS